LPCKVAGFVPHGSGAGQLDLSQYLSSSELRTMSQGSAYALVACEEAFREANWRPETPEKKLRTGEFNIIVQSYVHSLVAACKIILFICINTCIFTLSTVFHNYKLH